MASKKKVVLGIITGVILLFTLVSAGKLYEDIDAGEIVVIQDAWDGDLHVYKTPGMVWQGWGKATHYKKSNQFWFTVELDGKDTVENKSIPVKWNDGGTANVSGSVRYDLPLSDVQMVAVHSTFGSQEAIERDLIKTNIEKAIGMTGPLMTSKESYAEKKNDLIYYIEDQASKGVYRTKQVSVKEIDPITEAEKTVTKVEIINDTKGLPFRQEVSPIASYGVKLYNISIKDMHYSADVEAQIRTQQQATMQVQTAIANAKRAEQEALTTAKQGEADAAKAKWEQEVIKAKLVTEAEANKAVAQLAVQTAELNKQKLILEGEGEAAKKRLSMQANGALEQKLAAYIETQRYWADAFSKYTGSLVPLYQSGSSNGSSAMNWMEIMGMKAAKDLNLDLKNKD
jgi:regulator of protease activity HflC (stomatin/prohibitin superfamily)